MRSKMGERLLSSLAGLRFCFLNLFSGHSGDLPHNKITQGSSAEGSEVCIVLPRIFGAKCIRLGPVWKLHVSMLLLLLFFFPFASICLLWLDCRMKVAETRCPQMSRSFSGCFLPISKRALLFPKKGRNTCIVLQNKMQHIVKYCGGDPECCIQMGLKKKKRRRK